MVSVGHLAFRRCSGGMLQLRVFRSCTMSCTTSHTAMRRGVKTDSAAAEPEAKIKETSLTGFIGLGKIGCHEQATILVPCLALPAAALIGGLAWQVRDGKEHGRLGRTARGI